MKPVMQTMFHDKDGVGNCFEACLATMMEIDINEIPLFHGDDWFPEFWTWIHSKGYTTYTTYRTFNPDKVPTYNIGINGYFIVAGESPRGKHIKGGHAVVYKNGKMVHDPHPDGTGILNIKYGLAIESIAEA